MRCRNPKDFYAGLLFAGLGAAFVLVAHHYHMGNALRMGPAYFPTITGGLLALLGIVQIGRSITTNGEAIERIGLRAVLLVLGSLVVFGVLVNHIGLIPGIVALVYIAAAGGHEFRFWEVSILTVVMVALALAIFYYGLGMPFTLGPRL